MKADVADLPARLAGRVTITSAGCWEWNGRRTAKGYGHVYYQGTTLRVHRLTYEMLVGRIPEGMEIHHVCENEPCCNPAHLVVCTSLFNTNQKPDVNKARCIHGHEMTEDNTRVQVDRRGHVHRSCRACARARKALARAS